MQGWWVTLYLCMRPSTIRQSHPQQGSPDAEQASAPKIGCEACSRDGHSQILRMKPEVKQRYCCGAIHAQKERKHGQILLSETCMTQCRKAAVTRH